MPIGIYTRKKEYNLAHSKRMTGRKLSEEHKKKIGASHTGMKRSEEAKRKMSLVAMGKPGTNLGKKFNDEWKRKISESQKGKKLSLEHIAKLSEENHSNWKGDKVKYGGLHIWIRKKLGKPDTCSNCGKNKLTGRKIHWANKSQEYKRNLNDWLRLCVPCHKAYDRGQLVIEGQP